MLGSFRDLTGCAGLFDNEVVGLAFDDAFELGFLVAGANQEQSRFSPYAAVGLWVDG